MLLVPRLLKGQRTLEAVVSQRERRHAIRIGLEAAKIIEVAILGSPLNVIDGRQRRVMVGERRQDPTLVIEYDVGGGPHRRASAGVGGAGAGSFQP